MKNQKFETITCSDSYFVILEGNQHYTVEDFYHSLSETLLFPDYFGNNLDALYDMLTDLQWLPYENIYVIIKNADTFFSSFPEFYEEIEHVFRDALDQQTENKQIKLFLSDIHAL